MADEVTISLGLSQGFFLRGQKTLNFGGEKLQCIGVFNNVFKYSKHSEGKNDILLAKSYKCKGEKREANKTLITFFERKNCANRKISSRFVKTQW